MSTKKNSPLRQNKFWFINFASLLLTAAAEVRAQMPSVPVPSPPQEAREDFTWWYVSLFVLVFGLIGAIAWVINSKKAARTVAGKPKNTEINNNSWETDSLDANKELEWLRKNPKLVGKNNKPAGKNSLPSARKQKSSASVTRQENLPVEKSVETEKILPVFTIERIELARPFAPLPLSNDDALMSAIEQTQDEFEEDEAVRELALRILTAFKTRNSVESLAQMALYDLSANLRSRAVTILSEFNHESVFETILQASADPTREVRAAAARALSKLTFNRADAWSRIFESEEEGRMRQAARAATESGFVEMSFERLIHADEKYSYEAFVLMALLIKAGETGEIFRALENHKNMNVRKAILHVIKITKDQKALDGLYSTLEQKNLPLELQEEIDKTIEEIGFVTV